MLFKSYSEADAGCLKAAARADLATPLLRACAWTGAGVMAEGQVRPGIPALSPWMCARLADVFFNALRSSALPSEHAATKDACLICSAMAEGVHGTAASTEKTLATPLALGPAASRALGGRDSHTAHGWIAPLHSSICSGCENFGPRR